MNRPHSSFAVLNATTPLGNTANSFTFISSVRMQYAQR
jgi:hypothetical protein